MIVNVSHENQYFHGCGELSILSAHPSLKDVRFAKGVDSFQQIGQTDSGYRKNLSKCVKWCNIIIHSLTVDSHIKCVYS